MVPGLGAGKIALYAFILIFCAIGVGLFYGAIVAYQNGETTDALMLLVAGLVRGVRRGRVRLDDGGNFRSQAREAALLAAHPDEPWMMARRLGCGRIPARENSPPGSSGDLPSSGTSSPHRSCFSSPKRSSKTRTILHCWDCCSLSSESDSSSLPCRKTIQRQEVRQIVSSSWTACRAF